MVKEAINFYAKDLKSGQKGTITDCLKIIEFGMGNTLLTFIDQYYEHGGSLDAKDRGLTIRGYESAWLADLVASYNLDNTEDLFENTSKYHGIYRDDGIAFFTGKWSDEEIMRWISVFRLRVNDLMESDGLQFTAEIWRPAENTINERTIVNKKNHDLKREILSFSRY